MRKIQGSMRVVAVILVAAFVSLGAFMAYTMYTQSSRWVTTQYNPMLTNAKKTMNMGTITDRTGTVLATSDSEGSRQYAASKSVRRALSQTVGDQLSMSGTGVETFHAGTLLGITGSIIDRTWQYVTGQSQQGENIRLTVSAELATYIAEQFPSGKEGAVAVINYKTGEILAMVSKPDYDPQKLVDREEGAGNESGTAFLNRCLQGQYTPGSIFKVVTLVSALENLGGIEERTFTCEGSRAFGQGKVTCYGGEVHGALTLREAFAKSCNVTFAAIAEELGDQRLAATAERMGFNDNFSFRDTVLYQSSIPTEIADLSELVWTGDGQGKLLVTPLHMAMIAGAVGNGGSMMEPKLIEQVTGVGGIPRLRAPTGEYARVMSPSMAGVVGSYMKAVVKSGTGTKAKIKNYTVCGKTGTAEISSDKKTPDNAWFIGYVEEPDAPYAIAVVIEGGGSGGTAAAPLAQKALKKAISLGIAAT